MRIIPRKKQGAVIRPVAKTRTPGRRSHRATPARSPKPTGSGAAGIPLPEGLSPDQVTIVETAETYHTRSKGVTTNYLENE